jgi:high-affinity Fe2+/Pb2+ permease
MNNDQKRVLGKVLLYGAIAYGAYKIVKGIKENKTPEAIVEDIIKTPVVAAEKVVKKAVRFVKGSPEAIAHMANLRKMQKHNKKEQPKKDKEHKAMTDKEHKKFKTFIVKP